MLIFALSLHNFCLILGYRYQDVTSRMAIYEGNCVFEVKFLVADAPREMYVVINAETEGIQLLEDHLKHFPGSHAINKREAFRSDTPTASYFGTRTAGGKTIIFS